jgi:coenzyme F420-0:L-glutamate ligase/coenzyme F420-1:gamma-L-glutamate ligase
MSVAHEVVNAVARSGEILSGSDVLVLAQKIVSKSEGRQIRLADIVPGEAASRLARDARCAPELAQLILDESSEVLRRVPRAVIVRHRTGHVLANAGIDSSNVEGGTAGQVLLWPEDPDASSRAIRREIKALSGAAPAVVIADSMSRAWRIGTLGTAIGCAGLAILQDRRGETDLFGRRLQVTIVAVADAIAAAAVLVMGEGDEGVPAAIIRGAGRWVSAEDGPGAASGLRPIELDLFR